MRRRDFLKVASGAVGTAAAVGSAAAEGDPSGTAPAQQSGTTTAGNGTTTGDGTGGNGTATGNETDGGDGDGGETVTVDVSSESDAYTFTPGTEDPLYVSPGTTVEFVWRGSLAHNVEVSSQPGDASWGGHETLEVAPFTYTHTFDTLGEYEYVCTPHEGQGMVGSVVVNESGQAPAGGGSAELTPHEMGVPFQAHFVGIATVLMMVVSVVYTFFVMKYGESRHASGGN